MEKKRFESKSKKFLSVSDVQSQCGTTVSGTKIPENLQFTARADPQESYTIVANYKNPEKSVASVNLKFFEKVVEKAGLTTLAKKLESAFEEIEKAKTRNYQIAKVKREKTLAKKQRRTYRGN